MGDAARCTGRDGGTAKIQRANLDGSQVEDLITTGLSRPEGLALDGGRGKMYWTDWSTAKIQRANLDGSQVEDLITTGLGAPLGIALDDFAVSGGSGRPDLIIEGVGQRQPTDARAILLPARQSSQQQPDTVRRNDLALPTAQRTRQSPPAIHPSARTRWASWRLWTRVRKRSI